MATERPQPTPEISVNPAEALRGLKQNPSFENRLMANFVEQRVDQDQMQAFQRGDSIIVHGPIDGSPLSLSLSASNDTKYWRLRVRSPQRGPDLGKELASVYRQNMIGMDHHVGALEGGFYGGLSNPYAADAMRVLADLSDMDRKTRNIKTILEGYPEITDPVALAYIKLIKDFTDPTRLRAAEGYMKDPPRQVAGIIDDPRLSRPSAVILNVHGRGFLRDREAHCYIDWSSDRDEEIQSLKQTVFGFNPDKGYSFADGTYGLEPGTVRHEISNKMLTSLNEGVVSPVFTSR